MKQTNNAIKFLMAQYRAIFKHAYLKGLASAVILTAGLAAGSANATFSVDDLATADNNPVEIGTSVSSASAEIDQAWAADAIVKTDGLSFEADTYAITLSGSGSLTVQLGADTETFSLTPTSSTIDIDIATVNVDAGTLAVGAAASDSGARINATNFNVGTNADATAKAVIALGALGEIGEKNTDDLADNTLTIGENGSIKVVGSGAAASATAESYITVGTLNISGGTLDTDSSADSGELTIKLANGTMSGENAKINIAANGDIVNLNFADLTREGTDVEKVFDVQSGKVTVDGTLNVSGGTLQLGASTLDAASSGNLTIQQSGTLAISSTDLKAANKATISISTASSTLELTDTAQVDLGTITFADTAEAGKVGIEADGATIKGNDLLISSAFATSSNAPAIEATSLTLGDESSAGGDLGFSGATTKNITFLSNSSFSLANDITLRNITVDGADITANSDGTISGNVTVSGGKKLTVDGGVYSDSYAVTVDEGELHVTNTKTADKSSLTLTGDLKLVNTNAGAEVLVSGSDTILDISQATLDITEGTSYSGTFTVGSSALLISNAKNVQRILTADTGNKASAIVLDEGTLKVTDALTLAEDTFTKTGNAAAGKIDFDNTTGGTLEVANTLTITGSNGTVDIGTEGSIVADSLSLQNVKSSDRTVTLASGDFTVANGLTTTSTSDTVVLTNGNLTLGKVTEVDGTSYYSASSGGNALTNLQLSGSGNLKFDAGNWVIQNLELTSDATGSVNIGSTDSQHVDANGKAITSTVNGNTLTVDAGAVTINSTGTAAFKEAYISQASGVAISGSMTINGKYTAADGDSKPATYGLNLVANSIAVSSTGTLSLGADATKAITVEDSTVTLDDCIQEGAFAINGGKLSLSFGSDVSLDADALTNLKEALVAGGDLNNGVLNVGQATITGLTDKIDEDGNLAWSDAQKYEDILEDYSQDELSQAVVTGITASDNVKGHFGALSSETLNSGSSINLTGNTSLSTAANNDNKFASGVNGAVLGFTVTDNKVLKLENGGEAGAITLGSGSEVSVSSGDTTLASVNGSAGSSVTLTNAKTTVTGNAKAATFTTDAASTFTVKGDLETVADATAEASSFAGTVQVSGNATFNDDTELLGDDNTFAKDVTANDFLGVYGDTNVSGNITVKQSAEVADNATLTAETLTLADGKVMAVGSDGDDETSGSTGYLEVTNLKLSGGTLIIDPNYSYESSIGSIKKFTSTTTTNTQNSLGGVLSGTVAVAQNAGLMIGEDASKLAMSEFLAQYQDSNGALQEDKLGAIAYLTFQVTVAAGSQLIIDAAHSKSEMVQANGTLTNDYANTVGTADLYLGKNSALAVDDSVLDEGVAIYFNDADASIKGESGSKIVLVGDAFLDQDTIKLFEDAGNDGVLVEGTAGQDDIRVETQNGLLYFMLTAGQNTTAQSLIFDTYKAESAFTGASSPVRESLLAYASKTANYSDYYYGEATTNQVKLVGEVANSRLVSLDDNGDLVLSQAATDAGLTATDFVVVGDVIYNKANNSFLNKVTRNSNSGVEADQAARMAAFGGSMQVALAAGAATYDAVAGRMGVGAQTGNITFADNGQGAGLWITPVYKNHDSDGFEAQGLNYGIDMDLFGVALGADYTLSNGLRIGAAFNVGSGDADGQGAGSAVSNDFDYYGFTVYGGYTLGALSLVGDISYTVVDNDLEANTAVEKLTSSTDTSMLSVGVTGQYVFNLASVDVTPHAGLRYSYLDMDDYTVTGEDGEVGRYSADSMSVFSIPVGVTLSKDITLGDWTIKPAFDVTLTANMGDDTTDGSMSWIGVTNLNTNVQTEVLDDWTYGATLGVSAKTGNLSLGFGVNYTGSSNADEYGVGANARFVF